MKVGVSPARLQGQHGGGRSGGAKGAATPHTLRRMTWGWVEGFLNISKAFRRLDAAEGTYLKEIQVRLTYRRHDFALLNRRVLGWRFSGATPIRQQSPQ